MRGTNKYPPERDRRAKGHWKYSGCTSDWANCKLHAGHLRCRVEMRSSTHDLQNECMHFVITVSRMCEWHIEHLRIFCDRVRWIKEVDGGIKLQRTMQFSTSFVKAASFCETVSGLAFELASASSAFNSRSLAARSSSLVNSYLSSRALETLLIYDRGEGLNKKIKRYYGVCGTPERLSGFFLLHAHAIAVSCVHFLGRWLAKCQVSTFALLAPAIDVSS